jgi:radical SAM superfamily enzyme YgiQ (UPF0313 family)
MTHASTLVLATSNARHHHASLALRTLYANLGPWQACATMAEFTESERPVDIAERILAYKPRIVGLSVYIWNVETLTAVARILKQLQPDVILVAGGPEVSHELETQPLTRIADHIVVGEGEDALRNLLDVYLAQRADATDDSVPQPPSLPRIIQTALPDLTTLALPYDAYTDLDLEQRTVYVEASRGCPYRCEFCLSSLDTAVRTFPLDRLLPALDRLFARGARHFKFIDRTFNLKLEHAAAILRFFDERQLDGLLLHFEMVPDRLPDGLRELIARFPPGMLQFEVGVQTLDEAVSNRISRRQNVVKMAENLAFLRDHSGVHVHADLIIGLPGETLASFGAGLDRLFAMGPHEIQVGILKRLRGAPISRHTSEFQLIFDSDPPYEILATSTIDFHTMQRLKRFAFVWDRLMNRGNLPTTAALFHPEGAPFEAVLGFSDWLHATSGRVHALSLDRLAAAAHQWLVDVRELEADAVGAALARDYAIHGRRLPSALQPSEIAPEIRRLAHRTRQDRHLRGRHEPT